MEEIICVMPDFPCDDGLLLGDNHDDDSAECAAAVAYPPGHPCNESHEDEGGIVCPDVYPPIPGCEGEGIDRSDDSAECAAAVAYPPGHPCNKSAAPTVGSPVETDQDSSISEEAKIDSSDSGSKSVDETEQR